MMLRVKPFMNEIAVQNNISSACTSKAGTQYRRRGRCHFLLFVRLAIVHFVHFAIRQRLEDESCNEEYHYFSPCSGLTLKLS